MIYPTQFETKIGFNVVRDLISERCTSQGGRDKCASMGFSTRYEDVKRRLERVWEMMTILRGELAFPFDGVYDVATAVQAMRVAGAHASGQDLMRLLKTLRSIESIVRFFATHRDAETGSSPYPRLDAISRKLRPFTAEARAINAVIDEHGDVRDNASPRLAEIRSELSGISNRIADKMRRVIASAVREGFLDADTTPAVRDGRPVIPVAPMYKRKIHGIVHDESATGKTYYIEPAEVVEANNRKRELEIEESHEIMRILVALSDELRPSTDAILYALDVMAYIDFVHAKARFAIDMGAEMPYLSQRFEMDWYHAIHPVLKTTLERQGKDVVPLNISLDSKHRILIISGPNAGGKSVTLKTVAMVQYMTQCGVMPTVYSNSRMGIINDIFIDIGDDQSIENDLSTYSSHLRNMKQFLLHANQRSLILIDEFGSGTEPRIGGALAQAMLEVFVQNKAFGVITTHFQNLKEYADETPGLVNGSMQYDRQNMRPFFSLSIGTPGSSFALEIARKTGIPTNVMTKAEELVGSEYVDYDKYLLDIARDRKYWENKRAEIRRKEKQLDEIIERYANDADALRSKRREILDDARKQANEILEGTNALIERTVHDIRRAQADKEKTKAARKRLNDRKENLSSDSVDVDSKLPSALAKAEKATKRKKKVASPEPVEQKPKQIEVGSTVLLDGTGQPGVVMEISGKNAIVAFGNMRMKVDIKRLQYTLRKVSSGAAQKAASYVTAQTTDNIRSRQLDFKPEIDVRGMRTDEAIQAVTYFIDDAIQFSIGRVRILHGTGTGALRQYIRQYLSTVPGVKSAVDEDVRFGGAGITVVTL